MSDRKKYTLVALMVTAAGFAYINSSRPDIPADLRDAVADNGEFNTVVPALEKDTVNIPVPKAAVAVKAGAADIAESYLSKGQPSKPIEWVSFNGGRFQIPTYSGVGDSIGAVVNPFDISKAEVTVEQYAECVDKGECRKPIIRNGDGCNYRPGRQLYPMNCIDWFDASAYAKFKGGRLPSSNQWLYAATSGGKHWKYPWGSDEPTCDRVVMRCNGSSGVDGTLPVCSKPAGNTEEGLCDIVGNVQEWTSDRFGSGTGMHARRVVHGSSFAPSSPVYHEVGTRTYEDPASWIHSYIGFRIARETPADTTQQRIKDCYSLHHEGHHGQWESGIEAAYELETARAFLKCQEAKESQLQKKNPKQSSGEIVSKVADAIDEELPKFAKVFDQLFK